MKTTSFKGEQEQVRGTNSASAKRLVLIETSDSLHRGYEAGSI
jgi:hypothetical protein